MSVRYSNGSFSGSCSTRSSTRWRRPKDALHVAVGFWVEAEAEGVDTLALNSLTAACIGMQVLLVVHVDVCGFAVGEQQQQPLVGRALRQCVSSVAQRAYACRPVGLQGGKPPLCGVVPPLGKPLMCR